MQSHSRCRWLIGLTLTLSSQLGIAAELYRWTDDEGKVHYTDRVPPQYVEQGYSIMTEQGLTIHTIKPVSAEPIIPPEQEKTKLSPEQEKRDRKLLMNYASEGEITEVRDRKIEELNGLIRFAENNSKQLEKQYRDLTLQASDFEKQGKEVPDAIVEKITITKQKIKTFAQDNIQRKAEIDAITRQAERDLKRYHQLTQSDKTPPPESELEPAQMENAPLAVKPDTLKQQITDLETGITNQNRLQAKLEARFKEVFSEIQAHKMHGQAVPGALSQELSDLKLEIQQSYMNNLQNNSQLQALREELKQLNQK